MKLDRIEVRGFKSIREMNLEMRSLNLLIGANGAGKSNFVSLFSMLNNMVEKNLQSFVARAGGAEALLHFGQKRTPELYIALHFGSNGWKARFAPTQADTLFFEEETCWYQGKGYSTPYPVYLGRGHTETGLHAESAKHSRSTIADHVLKSLRSWKVYHFHDTSSSAKVKQVGDIDDDVELRADASNLAALLFRLQNKHPAEYKTIVGTIRMVAPFFQEFALRPSSRNPDKIRLEWREVGSDGYFNGHTLSDGTLRFICLATLLLQPNPPSTVLIDEPELGLHPAAIHLLADMLQVAAHRTQVIVATQSVTLLNQMDSEQHVIVVDREDEQSVFRRPDPAEVARWTDGFSLGELWEKNVLGGHPSQVLPRRAKP